MTNDAAAPPRLLIGIAAALAVALAVVVAIIGLSSGNDGDQPQPLKALPLPAIDAPDAGSPECARLSGKLPDTVASGGQELARRKLADPAPEAAAAWGAQNPVVLRCGVRKPRELKPTSKLLATDGVRWFQAAGPGTTTWYAVDRPVYVALTLPADSGTGVVQDLSKAVRSAMKPKR
ncbi:MAG: DUF3515 domain-containing protein [Thermocrispum sp.]